MPIPLLTTIIVLVAAAVIVAIVLVMWSARTTPATSRTAMAAGFTIALSAVAVSVLGVRGAFLQSDVTRVPPVGIAILTAFAGMAAAVVGSASLRSLLTNQQHLIRLNVWRLLGIVFLVLMLNRQMPALWALPAGIGDVFVGATAFRVARGVATPTGRRRAVIFNLLGMLDLIVAVGLGITTSEGPLRLFHTVPTSELATRFPLVMVPTFLVPLAFTIHVISLTQLLRGSWARSQALASR
jgi:hypothetical protein